MASGSSGHGNSLGPKSFDFASDDILCSYEDYGNQDGSNGTHADSIAHDSSQDFHKSRMSRLSDFPASTYSPPEESSFNQGVISAMENTVKKYTDNLMRFLEGISSRLSQLELYCYNLDKSIGEMRSELSRDSQESESKLKSLEKHVQEVHRSVQILRDKQELADTQKELAKLQLAQKESSSSQKNEDKTPVPSSEVKNLDASIESHDQKLALVPHQPAAPIPQPQPQPQPVPQVQAYYQSPPQMAHPQPSQAQYPPNQSQVQELPRMPHPQPQPQSQINQIQPINPYQQQWIPQQRAQQPIMQPQVRTPSQLVYSPYLHGQSNPAPPDLTPGSVPMQVTYPGASQTGPEAMSYPYGSSSKPIQQISGQHLKTGFGAQSLDGYISGVPRPAHPATGTYMIYNDEGRSAHHVATQSHYQQSHYPPTPQNPPRMPIPNMGVPQSTRGHPYYELIEKLVSMGYRGEHVIGVIQSLEESNQPVDFNSVLDRMNGGPRGGW